MEWSKIKNIILLILLTVNLLLLGQAAAQESQRRRYQAEALEGAVEVLRQHGYTVAEGALPTQQGALISLTAERDRSGEEALAQALLGTAQRTEDGARTAYQGAGGSCWFRGDGSFAFLFTSGAQPLDGVKIETHAEQLLRGVAYTHRVLGMEDQAGETRVQVVQTWEEQPVFSCTAELVYRDGSLIEFSGTRLVGPPVYETEGEQGMDLPTALIRFMSGMQEGGHVFTRIERMTEGYRAVGASRRMTLRPVWEVDTNVETVLVDGVTGVVIGE